MKNKLVLFLVFAFPYVVNSQIYEFVNDVIYPNADSVYVQSKFEPLEESYINYYLTEEFLRQEWAPLPTKDLPSLDELLKNVDLEKVRIVAARHNALDDNIDFSQLDSRFIKITKPGAHLNKNKNYYTVLSRPIFNQNEDWAIIYYYSAFYPDVGNSGEMRIFRKVDGQWTFYWQIQLWIS